MANDKEQILDWIAAVTADLDQAQAKLDDLRSRFPNDQTFQFHMDHHQARLDYQRKQLEILKRRAISLE